MHCTILNYKDNHKSQLPEGEKCDYWNLSDLSKLVTPLQNKYLPVYRWFNYKHSFSRNLVRSILEVDEYDKHKIVYDPFCGAGTTLLASKEMGYKVLGTDIMPLSVFVSKVKTGVYSIDRVHEEYETMKKVLYHGNLPKIPKNLLLISKYFPEKNLRLLLALRDVIRRLDEQSMKDFFFLALLKSIEDSSWTRKDGAFLRMIDNKLVNRTDKLFFANVRNMYRDLKFLNTLPKVRSKVFSSDARKTDLAPSSVSTIITSPPYPNRHDYTRIYLLELMIGFYDNYDDVKRLRYELIRSHVEGREKFPCPDYEAPDELITILSELNKVRLPNRSVITLLDGYFKDFYITLKEMYRILAKGGRFYIVVGDSRYGGITVPAGNLVKVLAERVGFYHLETKQARDKGNSPQQMGTFGKTCSPESIISLEKN